MIKSVTIFKNIGDLNALLRFYAEEIFPTIHELPGVICTDITSISQVSPDIAQDLDGIEVIMETHFESKEAMDKLIFSSTGSDLMIRATQVTPCEVSFFIGREKRFSAELTENLRQSMSRIGYED
jgi:hypothetical protein